jgi:hypothetical protein
LDGEAFCKSLPLTLDSAKGRETQRIRGLGSWGLFDLENGGRLIDPNRDELPLKSYLLVSSAEMDSIVRDGFDEDDYPVNERYELSDSSVCYVTRLYPLGKRAGLHIKPKNEKPRILDFRPHAKIEAHFFVGLGHKAALFSRKSSIEISLGYLPILCVAIPNGYFNDNKLELEHRFKVLIDGKTTAGRWQFRDQRVAIDSQFYFWRWDRKPLVERRPGVSRLTTFGQLRDAYKPSDLGGKHTFMIEAVPHIRRGFDAEIHDRPSPGLEGCWQNLPGAYLPLVLISQNPLGMKWEDLLLAKDIIAPGATLSPFLLRKYEQHGILQLRGRRWEIRESRAETTSIDRKTLGLNYCGDPSKLWSFYKHMSHQAGHKMLPKIEVRNKRGEVPYLEMDWPQHTRSQIEDYFERNKVVFKAILWTH